MPMSLCFYLGRDDVTCYNLRMNRTENPWLLDLYALNKSVLDEITFLEYSEYRLPKRLCEGKDLGFDSLDMFGGLRRVRRVSKFAEGIEREEVVDVVFEKIGGEWKQVEKGRGLPSGDLCSSIN